MVAAPTDRTPEGNMLVCRCGMGWKLECCWKGWVPLGRKEGGLLDWWRGAKAGC